MFKFTLFFAVLVALTFNTIGYSQDMTAQEIISKVQNTYRDITDAKASFSMTVKPKSGKANSSSGTLFIKKENKYRIETGGQIIVTDGSTSWSYNPRKKQVIVDNYSDNGNTFSPNKYLFQYPENFYSDLEGSESLSGKDTYVLKLKHREGGYIKSAKLWVDKAEWLIRKIVITTDESTTTYTVKNIQLNAGVANSKFSFTAPEGVEVIDMR